MLKVCVLSPEEARSYSAGEKVNCRNHRHVKRSEAVEMVRPDLGMPNAGANRPEAVARWLDRKHIVLTVRREWRQAWSGYVQVMQLLPVGARTRNPFEVKK